MTSCHLLPCTPTSPWPCLHHILLNSTFWLLLSISLTINFCHSLSTFSLQTYSNHSTTNCLPLSLLTFSIWSFFCHPVNLDSTWNISPFSFNGGTPFSPISTPFSTSFVHCLLGHHAAHIRHCGYLMYSATTEENLEQWIEVLTLIVSHLNFDRVSYGALVLKMMILPCTTSTLNLIPSPTLPSTTLDLLPYITHSSMKTGHVPPAFKSALVTPVLKKTTLNITDVISFLSKVLSKLNQSGFKEVHPSETALLTVTKEIHAVKTAKHVSVLILVYYSAAFDMVSQMLLVSLIKLVITRSAWQWIIA